MTKFVTEKRLPFSRNRTNVNLTFAYAENGCNATHYLSHMDMTMNNKTEILR